MASNEVLNGDSSTAAGAARRLLTRDPGLVVTMARSLLDGRKALPRSERREIPRRRLLGAAGMREAASHGIPVDPNLAYRALAHAIDPRWTRGHRFSVAYELSGEGGGRWVIGVDDGSVRVDALSNGLPDAYPDRGSDGEPDASIDATVRMSVETWRRVLAGELTPAQSMQQQLVTVEGQMTPVTQLGRWIDRAAGIDGPELEREARQREIQRRRAGSWGASANGEGARGASKGAPPGMGDPAHAAERRRTSGDLLTYEELYALWERGNWRVHELDFSVDREQWLVTPTEGQRHTAFSMASFYVGEERVTADLAPFLLAAPSGEIEAFLSTQLVDEARHAVFFDRFASEVMAIGADDLRGRLEEMEEGLLGPWHFLFDDSLRGVADRIKARPDDLELFVEGIVTYHMVTEGVLAMTGQRTILNYLNDHDLYPGFREGFTKVEQDEHRHIAFGVRFLRDVCEERPEMRSVVLETLERLLPAAAEVFAPPEAESPREFTSYAYHSSQVYRFAYMALKRRMKAIGIEIPGPERLMPGPIDPQGLDGPGVRADATPAGQAAGV
jgi:ribonucleoside-diphosphate reductase beta chain